MSTIDPAKLKVVELRAELSSRGLDAKGNKPVLVKRLKEALEQELEREIPDTSIADTSTEELNSSQENASADVPSEEPPDTEEGSLIPPEEQPEVAVTIEPEEPKKQKEPPQVGEINTSSNESPIHDDVQKDEENHELPMGIEEDGTKTSHEENGQDVDHEMEEDFQPVKTEIPEPDISKESEKLKTKGEPGEQKLKTELAEGKVKMESDEPKGEKRRRSSPSPERVQRRRSKTPIREDEPVIDNNKVQLSWYDSDLHLQVDKKSFLSGKPYHEGAFGYAWAGVRATHGFKSDKVCFEVKLTEELKWDDLVRQSERKRDGHRADSSKRDRQRTEKECSRSDPESGKGSRDSPKSDESLKGEDNKEIFDSGDKEKSEDRVKDKYEDKEKAEEESPKEQESEKSKENEELPEKLDSVTEIVDQEMQKEDEYDKKDITKEEEKQEPTEFDEIAVEPIAKHLFRVGWSVAESGLQLGETDYSYGYESSGKFVADKQFIDYGVKFEAGDVVGAYADVGEKSVTLTFTVNGELQPEATCIDRSELSQKNFALFPHILTRNYCFELNLGGREEPWFPHPTELANYVYLETVEDKVQGPLRPESRSECEVIMMCGLPASGKTHWVRETVKENPEKRYTVIGNSHLLDKMTVNGNPLKNNYKGRWNVILDRLLKCVNVLVESASLRRRNYIIDQTNVFPSAQRRKMRLFEGFKRRAVVVVVADEEQAKRRAQQEAQDGKDVPDSAILEMKANMTLPRRGEWLEEVSYVELPEEEAKSLVQKYNQQGREAGFGPISAQRSCYHHRDNRGHPYRWDHSTSRRDYRGGYRDNRSYQNNRYDRRQHGGWQNRRPPPGSWNRDIRRDSRGPPGGGSRDFRNNNRSSGSGSSGRQQDRSGSRDNRNRNQSSGSNFSRNQRSQSNRNQPANWQGGGSGSWQGQGGSWSGGGQGMWNQGNWNQGGWGGGQGQWKSGSGYGQGGYGQGGYGSYANWNYYGQYPQNWNSQGQPQTTTAGGTAASDSTNAAYSQYSQQAAWAQYAQQYAQQGQASSSAATQQSSTQK